LETVTQIKLFKRVAEEKKIQLMSLCTAKIK